MSFEIYLLRKYHPIPSLFLPREHAPFFFLVVVVVFSLFDHADLTLGAVPST